MVSAQVNFFVSGHQGVGGNVFDPFNVVAVAMSYSTACITETHSDNKVRNLTLPYLV